MSGEFRRRWIYLAELALQSGMMADKAESDAGDADDLLLAGGGVESGYVVEAMLEGVDLEGGRIVEDAVTGEAVLFHVARPGTRWIVLANEWESAADSAYVSEVEASGRGWRVREEEGTGRRYVVGAESDRRFYVVDADKVRRSDFVAEWARIVAESKRGDGKSLICLDSIEY